MGSGSFNTHAYSKAATTYKHQERTSLFQSHLFPDFNPLSTKVRESCASEEHPDPTSIIIACDVTGSMGKIPESLLKGGLGSIMESLLKIKAISNPQVMFAAIGDMECDTAPLQVTQFESDNRIASQLKNLYLEGRGGGNDSESYESIWYFAAYKTRLDLWKDGKKGLLFTMGDELMPAVLKADHIRKFIDKDYRGADIPTSKLIKEVSEKYDVFHLLVQDTDTYRRLGAEKVNACWQQYLGERAILAPTYTDIPQKIISTVQSLCELRLNDKPVQAKSEVVNAKANVAPINEMMELGIFHHKSAKGAFDSSAVLNKDSDNIPHLFLCPISHEVMEDPVVAEDEYTYDRKSITEWLQAKNTSPMTNEIIGKLLTPIKSLKSEIEQWRVNQAAQPIEGLKLS